MKRRILVVDDESIVAHDISECLLHMGCEVVGTALSGPDAIAKAERFRPDLVMMDIVLQGSMDGVEAATVIRERFDIPCVFLTAYSDGAVLARAKAAAPAGYMVKPFEEAGLRSTVEIALYKVDLERALRESREWFMTTLMSIGDGVVATAADGRVRLMNTVAERMTGWPSHEAEGRALTEVFRAVRELDGLEAESLLHGALAEGQTLTREKGTVLVGRDGARVPIADTAAPIRSSKGDIVGAVLVFRDITERRRAERELEEHSDRLESMVQERTREISATNSRLVAEVEERRRAEQALARRVEMETLVADLSAAFLKIKPDETDRTIDAALARLGSFLRVGRCYLMENSGAGSVCDCTHEWCASGVPALAERFRGIPHHLLPPLRSDTESHAACLLSAIDAPGLPALDPDLARARGAGSLIWMQLGAGESPAGFLCVDSVPDRREWAPDEVRLLILAADVLATALGRLRAERDKARLQTQLQQSLKMEAVGKLSGGIAHDFNNMLLPIIGYSDMILQRFRDDDPSVIELREIKRAAEQAAALTRQLLAFSRKQVAKKTVFDLNENLGTMARMLGRIIGEDITFHMELSNGRVPVRADPGQVEQIVMNLVINARDALPAGGSIVLRTMLVDAARHPVPVIGGIASQGIFAVLTVADNGCGIPPEIQERIFEPFFTTKGMEGTGLGLSVVYGILQEHQGGLQLDSAPGRGTTLHIFLPAAPESALPQPDDSAGRPRDAAAARGHGEHVLLIEDEEAVNRLVRTALTQNGYVVTAAASVKEALEAFEAKGGHFDMIFSDAVLPDGNGLQLLDAFLTRKPALRALLSSGYTDKNSLLSMARQRRISFLPKPYTLPVLFRTVADVMRDQNTHLLV